MMISETPVWVSILFGVSTFFSIYLLWLGCNRNRYLLYGSISICIIQGIAASNMFYLDFHAIPPRFIFLVLPSLLLVFVYLQKGGRKMEIQIGLLTLLHVVRIPVEIGLFSLEQAQVVSPWMTFEGANPDILSGISAPVIYLLYRFNPIKYRRLLRIWNYICLLLLINIVGISILSAPTPFQQLAFEQPNVAVAYFPYSWLPSLIVPSVLLSHILVLRETR